MASSRACFQGQLTTLCSLPPQEEPRLRAAYSALKGSGLQSQLVSSGLQGTEEPTDSCENQKGIYHPAEQSVWKQGQFRH